MSPTSTNQLEPTVQRTVDDLYWNSTSTVKAIAELAGVTAARLPRLVTPLAAGVDCWWCGHTLTWASRSERSSERPLVCQKCGAHTPHFAVDPRLQESDATIVVVTTGHRTPRDLSTDVSDETRALADVGLRWSGRFEPVDVRRGPHLVVDAIRAIDSSVVVVPSVRSLGISQGDAFGTFRLLLQTDVRIITARDIIWASADWHDRYDPYSSRWSERVALGRDFPSDVSDGGRSWADEYRLLALEDRWFGPTGSRSWAAQADDEPAANLNSESP